MRSLLTGRSQPHPTSDANAADTSAPLPAAAMPPAARFLTKRNRPITAQRTPNRSVRQTSTAHAAYPSGRPDEGAEGHLVQRGA